MPEPSPVAAPPVLDAVQRKALRAQAHHLHPVVAIGDGGLTPTVLAEVDRALRAHGLVKIRVHGDERDVRLGYLEQICTTLGCAPVQAIGKLLVVWREKPRPEGGGDAGTARRAVGRTNKKALGAAREAGSAAPSGRGTSAGATKRSADATSKGRSGAAKPTAATRGAKPAPAGTSATKASFARGTKVASGPRAMAASPARGTTPSAGRKAAAGGRLTRSARPGSGTRARRRAP